MSSARQIVSAGGCAAGRYAGTAWAAGRAAEHRASFRRWGRTSCRRFIPLTKSHYPQLQLAVHEDLTQHLLERLRSYQIDAALLALPLENQDLESLPLFDEPFWFACPPQHPLAQVEVGHRSRFAR